MLYYYWGKEDTEMKQRNHSCPWSKVRPWTDEHMFSLREKMLQHRNNGEDKALSSAVQ